MDSTGPAGLNFSYSMASVMSECRSPVQGGHGVDTGHSVHLPSPHHPVSGAHVGLPGRAFLYKYRPRIRQFEITRRGRETNHLLVLTRQALGGRRRTHRSDEGQWGHVVHGGRHLEGGGHWAVHAVQPGIGMWAAGARAAHHRTRRKGTDRLPECSGGAGRPEACESDFPARLPKGIRLFFFFFLFLSIF